MNYDLPPASWGRETAARIGGFTLIILAFTALLTALGLLDDNITVKTKRYIVEPMFALGLADRPAVVSTVGQQVSVNEDRQHRNDTATVMIPPGAVVIDAPHVIVDSQPTCRSGIDKVPQSVVGRDGEVHYTAGGWAGGCGTGNSTAAWHLEAKYIDLGKPIELTFIGKIIFGLFILWGFFSAFWARSLAVLKARTREPTQR